jgi:hypothetical protein
LVVLTNGHLALDKTRWKFGVLLKRLRVELSTILGNTSLSHADKVVIRDRGVS